MLEKNGGKARAIYSDQGSKLDKASPSFPIEIQGLSGAPESGDKLVVVDSESRAREVTQYRTRIKRIEQNSTISRVSIDQMIKTASQNEKDVISIIVKADVHGSKEAIEQSLKKMSSEKYDVKVIHTGVGEINESDVTLATASNARIFGFNIKTNAQAKTLAKKENISIKYFSIIYEVIDETQKILDGLGEDELIETLIGEAQVKQVFKLSDASKIAGCMIQSGKVTSNCFIKVLRNEEIIFEGDILSLRREKSQAKEVISGTECGIGIKNFNEILEKDILKFFTREKNEKNLSLELIKENRKKARISKISELIKRAIADTFPNYRFYLAAAQITFYFQFQMSISLKMEKQQRYF